MWAEFCDVNVNFLNLRVVRPYFLSIPFEVQAQRLDTFLFWWCGVLLTMCVETMENQLLPIPRDRYILAATRGQWWHDFMSIHKHNNVIISNPIVASTGDSHQWVIGLFQVKTACILFMHSTDVYTISRGHSTWVYFILLYIGLTGPRVLKHRALKHVFQPVTGLQYPSKDSLHFVYTFHRCV